MRQAGWMIPILLAATASGGQPVRGEPDPDGLWVVQTIAAADSPGGVAIGDADGDGRKDIIVANRGSESISVFRRTDSGWIPETVPIGNVPGLLSLADVDQDGRLEIVTANISSATVSILRRTGSGWIREDHAVAGLPTQVAIGDVDRDGHLDIVAAHRDPKGISVLRRTGDQWVRTDRALPLSGKGVAIGDVDHDGAPEIVVACSEYFEGSRLAVFSWTGQDWTLRVVEQEIYDRGDGAAVLIGDADGDGKNEIYSAEVVRWNGNSWEKEYWSHSKLPGTTALGDIDDDGDIDFLEGRDSFWWNGLRRRYQELPVEAGAPNGVAIGDLDADGDEDLVVSDGETSTVNVLTWKGNTWTEQVLDVGIEAWDVACGDLDGDGDLDVVTANRGSNNLSILHWSSGVWTRQDVPVGAGPEHIAIGDLDLDGDNELVVAHSLSRTLMVLQRNGADWDPTELGLLTSAGNLLIGDADNDGKPEILVLQGESRPPFRVVSLFKWNAGKWDRQDLETGDPGNGSPTGFGLGDADNDGANEIVMSHGSRGYLLEWTEGRWAAKAHTVVLQGLGHIVVGDLDHDGDQDLAGTVSNFTQLLRWTGIPGGSWTREILGDVRESRDLALGDLDADGDLDLATTYGAQLWNGSGWQQRSVVGAGGWSVAAADADNDGDADLLFAGNELNILRWTPASVPSPVSSSLESCSMGTLLLVLAWLLVRRKRAGV